MDTEIITRILMAFLATGGFSFLFKTPKRLLPIASLTGGLGWAAYEVIKLFYGFESAIILSSAVVGFLSHIFAKIFKTNVHPFITAGIVPLVPGASAFFAVKSFIDKNQSQASNFAYETFVSAFGIVIGIAISSYVSKILNKKDIDTEKTI
ncbi:MAG TPA: threonine/serine exporter family protein [Petrotogaceae bacterium]|mgnify:CR=1|jgi:uncharacterized membrane protein YjjB (DUF3815 family)|nr:threonine/serine exporter family protein [Petrotogaceae bacterium]HPX15295.1 threonine/serine exporter family protein [Petrotogaceae bacterium]HQC40128.1 threonine/serine exporter family protein [Petrotogaceae bacterium]HQO11986.1 threonine/serine exporter family protein [Petrotogaceae bacterium]HQP58673.1 threonine/serine exporter family protein [Petrotogaceae bacterium]